MKLTEGRSAPDFSLPDQHGIIRKLSDYRGGWVVLYFYPKDDTPGCTTEACGMRDNLPQFGEVEATVLGVSTDSVLSHKRFADKYGLSFTLLADEQKQVVEQYGVWGEKKYMGKVSLGVQRTTFLINPEGEIAKIYPGVKPEAHARDVLNDLQNLR